MLVRFEEKQQVKIATDDEEEEEEEENEEEEEEEETDNGKGAGTDADDDENDLLSEESLRQQQQEQDLEPYTPWVVLKDVGKSLVAKKNIKKFGVAAALGFCIGIGTHLSKTIAAKSSGSSDHWNKLFNSYTSLRQHVSFCSELDTLDELLHTRRTRKMSKNEKEHLDRIFGLVDLLCAYDSKLARIQRGTRISFPSNLDTVAMTAGDEILEHLTFFENDKAYDSFEIQCHLNKHMTNLDETLQEFVRGIVRRFQAYQKSSNYYHAG